MRTIYRFRVVAAALLLAFLPALLWSEAGASKVNSFAEENIQSFVERILDNGIPVIIKKNEANRVFNVKVVLEGSVAMTPREKAGLEAITLTMLTRGSERYSYDEIQSLTYEKSSGISASGASYDMGSFDLNTIDKYFDELFEVFTDSFLHPRFDPEQFKLVIKDAQVAYQRTMSDPYGYATTKLHLSIFAGHPYEADFQGTKDSLASITLDDVKKYYEGKIGPERMRIVAVGNFDAEALIAKLNGSFGKMATKYSAPPKVGRSAAKSALLLEAFEKSKGVAYVRGDFPIPMVGEKDYIALNLAFSILDELLFDIVRTKNGACYSIWSRAFGFKNPYGSLVIYQTSVPEKAKLYVDQAVKYLADGLTMNVKGTGDSEYAWINETIDAYKAKYINGFFAKQQTNAQIAAQIASSAVYTDDPYDYLKLIDRVNEIGSEDIVRVVKDYIVAGPITWIVVTDQATLDKVKEADYLRFTAK